MRTVNLSTDFDRPIIVQTGHSPMLSIDTPAYNEAKNLPVLYKELTRTLASLSVRWEWIIVDDHSRDETLHVSSK